MTKTAPSVGDFFECPEAHEAEIVWISEDKKVIAVKYPRRHLSRIEKVSDHTKPAQPYGHRPRKERKIYVENTVFLIRI
jgi:hypothetical protein